MSYRPFTDIWILARPKAKYYGAYPAGFLRRARDLIGCGEHDQVLHVCSGKVTEYKCGPSCNGHYHGFGKNDLTADLDITLNPDVIFDARKREDYDTIISNHPQIQGVLADPPYTEQYATNYNVGAEAFPRSDTIVGNSLRILPVGGRVGILSMCWPRYPKYGRQIALVGVYVGNGNIGRTFAVYERI